MDRLPPWQVTQYSGFSRGWNEGRIEEVVLANTLSAKKRVRQNINRRKHNRISIMRSRTFVKKARSAINTGDYEAAELAVRKATSELDRAASKGVIHRSNASRRKSRLMKQLATIRQS